MTAPDDGFTERAREILRESPLIDGHNDLAFALRRRLGGVRTSTADLRGHVDGLDTDIPRLREGGVGGQFWSVWVPADLPEPEALRMGLEQPDVVHRLVEGYPDVFELATTADEAEAAFRAGRIASLIGLEGGSMIASSMAALRQFHARGVRYMTLTHWRTTRWADAATDPPQHDGLTAFGREVVREMNRLGMLVDLSPCLARDDGRRARRHRGARDLLALRGPSGDRPRAQRPGRRSCAGSPANGGVVMAVFLGVFISNEVMAHVARPRPRRRRTSPITRRPPAEIAATRQAWLADHPPPRTTIGQVADHIDHLRDVAGIDHVGIGSDFDGGALLPDGLEDVAGFPRLIGELLRRGYSDDDVRAIAGGNVLRVMRGAEAAAARLQATRGPSEATIEELDDAEALEAARWLSPVPSARCGWSSPPTTTRRRSASIATSSGSRNGRRSHRPTAGS